MNAHTHTSPAVPVTSATGTNILDLHDKLKDVQYLVEAVHMAAGAIGDPAQVNALQAVCDEADQRLEAIVAMVDEQIDALREAALIKARAS
jgi:hypothetical protein